MNWTCKSVQIDVLEFRAINSAMDQFMGLDIAALSINFAWHKDGQLTIILHCSIAPK